MLNTLRVKTNDLYIGLFVCGLDRPWLSTPFLMQGFYINTRDDIDQVRQYCTYVLIDPRKSRYTASDLTHHEEYGYLHSDHRRKLDRRPRVPIDRIFQDRPIKAYEDDSGWEEEHPKAQVALDTLFEDINVIFSGVIKGQNINVIKLRRSIDPIIDSITRNPDACLWVARLKKHDEYSYQHSLGAAIWSVSLGRQLGLPRRDLRSLAMGCMLMDVGKLRVNPRLLRAERELTFDEAAEIADHIGHGLDIIKQGGIVNQDVIDIVAHHHERFDGSGYPNGLTRDNIPPFARIAGIVDTYDAVTSERGYASAMSPPDAIKLLYRARDKDFQAELVEAFIQAIGIYPAGTMVELSSGEVGVVVAEYRARRLQPKVMLLLDAEKNKRAESKIVDLSDVPEERQDKRLRIVRGLDPDAYGIDLLMIEFPRDLCEITTPYSH